MKWKSEREKNSDYIEQLRRNKEERKKEIEAQEALMIQMKEEQEAADAAAEAEAENMSDEADAKPAAAQKKPVEEKKNFADQKKFKSKEQQEFQEQLEKLIKPFDVAALDTDALKKKVEELYDIFTNLINDKININKRIVKEALDKYLSINDCDEKGNKIHIDPRYPDALKYSIKIDFKGIVTHSPLTCHNQCRFLYDCLDLEDKCEDLITHPVIATFIYCKWKKTRWFYFLHLFIYLLFIVVFSWLVIDMFGWYHTDEECMKCAKWNGENNSHFISYYQSILNI